MTAMARDRRDSGVGRRPLLPNGVLAMLVFVVTEVMFFAGLVSAFAIAKSQAVGSWPPYGQPRLPVEETAVNTAMLLASGLLLYLAHRAHRTGSKRLFSLFLGAILLGAGFVVFQGVEWVALIHEGLTMTSSQHGAFFYLIVGMHALHAVAAIVALAAVFVQLARGRMRTTSFWTVEVFWYFVVLIWPVLYYQVYLG